MNKEIVEGKGRKKATDAFYLNFMPKQDTIMLLIMPCRE